MSSASGMQLIDSHCHLDFPEFDPDREAVLARARTAGVSRLVNPGADLRSSQRAVALAETYPEVYAAVGVHPHDASTLDDQTLARLRQLATHPKVVAIGEIGLDYYRDLSPRAQQRAAFHAQLELAAELRLPVIVHQREAADDVLTILRAWAGRLTSGGVLHAFSASHLAMAKEALAMGFYIGIGGPITFANAGKLRETVPKLPLERLLIETDAPYLTPHPYRGQRNEPAHLVWVARRLAELHGVPLGALAGQVSDNTRRLFRLWETTRTAGA